MTFLVQNPYKFIKTKFMFCFRIRWTIYVSHLIPKIGWFLVSILRNIAKSRIATKSFWIGFTDSRFQKLTISFILGKCMFLGGLTPKSMCADDDYKLLDHGIGFTNVVMRATRGSANLTRKEIEEGKLILGDFWPLSTVCGHIWKFCLIMASVLQMWS